MRWLAAFTLLLFSSVAIPVLADSATEEAAPVSPSGHVVEGLPGGVRVAEGLRKADLEDSEGEEERETAGAAEERAATLAAFADKGKPVRWKLRYANEGKAVWISISTRYCGGGPKPRITRVRIRELEDAVIITVFMAHLDKPKKGRACAGLELGFSETVELSQNLGNRRLYDGSTSPPEKRSFQNG